MKDKLHHEIFIDDFVAFAVTENNWKPTLRTGTIIKLNPGRTEVIIKSEYDERISRSPKSVIVLNNI